MGVGSDTKRLMDEFEMQEIIMEEELKKIRSSGEGKRSEYGVLKEEIEEVNKKLKIIQFSAEWV